MGDSDIHPAHDKDPCVDAVYIPRKDVEIRVIFRSYYFELI